MSMVYRIVLMVLISGFCAAGSAETLQMGTGDNAAIFEQPGKPTRGMTQARVEQEYGKPTSRQAAVGDPPITRWEYAGFVVFFEYDRVIHSVSKR